MTNEHLKELSGSSGIPFIIIKRNKTNVLSLLAERTRQLTENKEKKIAFRLLKLFRRVFYNKMTRQEIENEAMIRLMKDNPAVVGLTDDKIIDELLAPYIQQITKEQYGKSKN